MTLTRKRNTPFLTYSFLALIFWLPLPLGSNRAWAWSIMELWIFSLALVVAILIYKQVISIPDTFKAAKPIFLLFFSFLIWTFIQIIPLPIQLIESITPHALTIIGSEHTRHYLTISADPTNTAKQLLKSTSFVLFFALLFIIIDNKQKLKWLIYVILASGLFQAVYGSFMVLTGIEYSFFFEKEHYTGSATGTFINRNHLAGYLEMTLAIGIGFMLSKLRTRHNQTWRSHLRGILHFFLSQKVIIRITLVLMTIGLIITHSRMGNTAFFASLLISGSLFIFISKHATRTTIIFITSLIILDIFLVGSWVGINKVVQRLESTSMASEQRDEVVRDSLTMIAEQPLTGIGAGNFSLVFPHYQQHDITLNYYHAHNDFIEFVVESGLIGTSILGLAVLYALLMAIQAMRKRKHPLMLGIAFASFMGILSIMIHSFVDFNLQIPANAAMFILFMGLAIISSTMSSR